MFCLVMTVLLGSLGALAVPLPGGTLDPLTIPKYVQPLVIPPEMPLSADINTPTADYNIAVRQFQQQILPGGVWNTVNGRADAFPATTIWSYGRAEDTLPANFVAPVPLNQGITFNYPSFTIETLSNQMTKIRWINDLVDANGNYLPHLFPIDQTLHWANPAATNCADGTNRTDCVTFNPLPYTGPVPMVTHVHGAHVNPESDGYPEAWWLPAANNIPAGYASSGSIFSQWDTSNSVPGSAFYAYENDQPATTLWYHDHSLGITRVNVYAGPAGFYLVRGLNDDATDGVTQLAGVLPGPAPSGSGDPNFDAAYRASIHEIPIVIQDRSFNIDGSLFYPSSRLFFDGYAGPYINGAGSNSDISPIWNPEAFFNTMVVNGTTWPTLDVAPERYRLRLLNGTNSRFLNLALFEVVKPGGKLQGNKKVKADKTGIELPFFQIGAEQGFLPQVVMIQTGFATPLPGDGTVPALVPAADPMQALLMGPAERADVIVDFTGLPAGTIVRMINTAPDAPFGGFPDVPADPSTTGQVMQFVVGAAPIAPDPSTPAQNLVLNAEQGYDLQIPAPNGITQVSLNEEGSQKVCVSVKPNGTITVLATFTVADPNIVATCAALGGVEMGPRAALLGTLTQAGGVNMGAPKLWMAPITENPQLGDTKTWEIYNFTMDGHPIHLHLVRFQVENRELLDPLTMMPNGIISPPQPAERGFKDTVIALPGQVTRIRATFDREGLYVWHCHILEHEDNEMMRPYYVGALPAGM